MFEVHSRVSSPGLSKLSVPVVLCITFCAKGLFDDCRKSERSFFLQPWTYHLQPYWHVL